MIKVEMAKWGQTVEDLSLFQRGHLGGRLVGAVLVRLDVGGGCGGGDQGDAQ